MAYNSTHTGIQIDAAVNVINTALPIANGGTGAQTAAGARTNLGAASQTDMTAAQDGITDLSTELASVENGLAYRETGATASRNISDGEYVFWNGAMYTANGNIASGTTLASGTNLTPTENALNALNSKFAPWFPKDYTTREVISTQKGVDIEIPYDGWYRIGAGSTTSVEAQVRINGQIIWYVSTQPARGSTIFLPLKAGTIIQCNSGADWFELRRFY